MSRITVFFRWFVAPEGRIVGSLKRRVRSHLARWEMKNCTSLWREAHFQVKMYKTHRGRTTFGSCDVEKVHAVVARNTFWSQNVQSTPCSDHFWKLRCGKSARRCGAKHISKSKCTKHTILGPLLEVDVEKVHAVVARSTFPTQNVQSTPFSDHFWKLMSKKCTLLWREAHFEVKMLKTPGVRHFQLQPPLHHTTLQHATLNYTQLHYTTLHYTPLHYTTLHYTTLPSTNYITLHYTTLHYITLRYTPLHYTKLHYTTLHYTTLPSTTLHYITLQLQLHNYTPLH